MENIPFYHSTYWFLLSSGSASTPRPTSLLLQRASEFIYTFPHKLQEEEQKYGNAAAEILNDADQPDGRHEDVPEAGGVGGGGGGICSVFVL